ncbi:MAG: sulfite exporter TauE/SafE family protein [Chloroflexi bacterium]|nr:sulfite exporter TauE/SafE family protein [Chloroflexota bacterium]
MTQSLVFLGLQSDLLLWQLLFLTVLSFGVGVLGGFVGLALGTMRLPAILLLGTPAPIAAGTNILVSTLSALTGSIRHLREGRVSLRIVIWMGIPAMVGALIGGFASGQVPERLLIGLVGLFVTWQGIELIIRARKARHASSGGPPDQIDPASAGGLFTTERVAAVTGVGLGVGLLGGAVGLILGSIRLPVIVRILRTEPRVAAGTNLLIGFMMGSFGWIGHVVQGNVDYPLLAGMGVSGMAGTFYGARLTGRVSLTALLLTMGWVLVAVGLLLLVSAYRK